MKTNNNLLKTLSKLAFVISAIYTCQLMLSSVTGIFNSVLTIGTVGILEFGKMFFATKSLEKNNNRKMSITVINGIVALFLFGVSIIASQSFLSNQNNSLKNKQLLTSNGYQQQLAHKESLKDLYGNKKEMIANLQQQTKQEVESLRNQREGLPKNYITKKSQISEQIKKLQSDSNDKLFKLNSGLENNVIEQNKEIDVKNVELSSTKGYTGFLSVLAEKISTEEKIFTSEELELYLFFGIAIIFEVVAIMLFYYQNEEVVAVGHKEFKETIPTASPVNNITPIKKSGIGFQYDNPVQSKHTNITNPDTLEPQLTHTNINNDNILKQFGCIDKEIVREYLINAEESKNVKNNGNEVSGVSVLSKKCRITENTGRNVFGYLKHLGIVEVKNRSSFLVKTPPEYNKILDL